MKGMHLAVGLAALALLVWSAPVRAGDPDTVQLNLTDKDAPAQTLGDDGQGADTLLTGRGGFAAGGFRAGGGGYRAGGFAAAGYRAGGYRAGGFAYGGYRAGGYGYRVGGYGYARAGYGYAGYRGAYYRPYYGGYRAGFAYGYGGYRPYYGGYYRAGFGYGGYYRPWWGWGGYYRPWGGWGWGGYWPWYGYGLGWGGYYPGYGTYGYYSPIVYDTSVGVSTPPVIVENGSAFTPPAPTPEGSVSPGNGPYPYDGNPSAPAPKDSGTYPYDGGPTNPVPQIKPMPKADPTAVPARPRPSVPLEGKSVSLPRPSLRALFPAYGAARPQTNEQVRDLLIRR